jgi:hypothetical protein
VKWRLCDESLKRDPSFDGDELLGSDGVVDEIDTNGDCGDERQSMAAVVVLLLACAAWFLLLALSLSGPSESSDGVGSPQRGPLAAACRSASRIYANELLGNGRVVGEIRGANTIRPLLRCGSRTSPNHYCSTNPILEVNEKKRKGRGRLEQDGVRSGRGGGADKARADMLVKRHVSACMRR